MIQNHYIQWCTLVKKILREFHVYPVDVHVCTGEINMPLSSNNIGPISFMFDILFDTSSRVSNWFFLNLWSRLSVGFAILLRYMFDKVKVHYIGKVGTCVKHRVLGL